MTTLTLTKPTQKLLPALGLVAAYLAIAGWYLHDYFIADLNVYLGLLLVPYVLFLKPGKLSFRYLLPALLFLALAILIPAKTLIYLAIIFGLLFLVESCIGKVSYYLLFLLFLISSVFRYFSNFFGFPLRLWLSEIAGKLLAFTGQEVKVSGNLLNLNGADFSVDPACTGLQMLSVSFLLALFMLAFYQHKTKMDLSLKISASVLVITLLLNIVANLFRIILLVLFRILPENNWHDLVGMACLVVYVVIPLLALTQRISGKQTESKTVENPAYSGRQTFGLLLSFLMFLATVFAAQNTASAKAENGLVKNTLALPGFTKIALNHGITKFENTEALIYVKPVRFFSAEHNPTICWTGSGYNFTHIQKRHLFGAEIYTGILQKDSDKLYTAWWFDQGNIKMVSQFKWRWHDLKTDAGFNLINVSAATPEELHRKLENLLTKPLFSAENGRN